MLSPCEGGCSTWIYTPPTSRRQLQTNLDFLGGTLTVSKEPYQLPLTSFQIGGEPCMDPQITSGSSSAGGFHMAEINRFYDCPVENVTS